MYYSADYIGSLPIESIILFTLSLIFLGLTVKYIKEFLSIGLINDITRRKQFRNEAQTSILLSVVGFTIFFALLVYKLYQIYLVLN